jgi:hypothetical protein
MRNSKLRWVCAGLSCWLCLHARANAQPKEVRLPIVLHMVEVAGQPIVSPEFVTERIARANQIFAPYGVAFEITRTRPLAERHAHLETRADRDALGAEVGKGVIDCFLVASLRDVDEPENMRRGVHWHSASHAPAHYVIVSSIAGLDVLAHELGHYLGNPQHSQTVGNLMSYQHTQALPFLDEAQQANVRRTLSSYLRHAELKALPAPH